MNTLAELRKEIDAIDEEIVSLLEKRMNISKEIKKVKIRENISVLDSGREKEILDKIESRSNYGELIAEIYKTIMRLSKEIQRS